MCSRFCPDRTLLIIITEPQHDISNNVLCATSKGLDQDLSLKGGCTGSSQSTLCQMPQCWKSHIVAQIIIPKQNCILPIHPYLTRTFLSRVHLRVHLCFLA